MQLQMSWEISFLEDYLHSMLALFRDLTLLVRLLWILAITFIWRLYGTMFASDPECLEYYYSWRRFILLSLLLVVSICYFRRLLCVLRFNFTLCFFYFCATFGRVLSPHLCIIQVRLSGFGLFPEDIATGVSRLSLWVIIKFIGEIDGLL
jgi:hypothetical protein